MSDCGGTVQNDLPLQFIPVFSSSNSVCPSYDNVTVITYTTGR